MSLKSLYKQELMDHFQNPRNFGKLDSADFASPYMNPSCGDKVVVMGIVQKGRIQKLMFQGSGCVLSLAMASKLTEYSLQKEIKQLLDLDEEAVKELLGIDLGPKRVQCGMLSIIALQEGLKSLK